MNNLLSTAMSQNPKPLRVLLMTGRGNTYPEAAYQDWIHTFYPNTLAAILAADATVEVVNGTSGLNPEKLAQIDVVINNSLFLEPSPSEFAALFDFVSAGGGFVALHAGLVSCLNDPRYEAMVGAKFIGHDPIGAFQVEARDNWYGWAGAGCSVHPIAQGLTTFGVLDELYIEQMLTQDLTVVARAKFCPVMWVRQHHQGRVVALALGHDQNALNNVGFQHLLKRGVVWAAKRELIPLSPDSLEW
jgi:uncharacterized protein